MRHHGHFRVDMPRWALRPRPSVMGPPDFTGTVRTDRGVTRLLLAGEIDIYSAPRLQLLLEEAAATGASSVEIDMALVLFCDATGLGRLVRAKNELLTRGTTLSVTAAPIRLRRLLAIAGLTDALHVSPATSEEVELAYELARAARVPLIRPVVDAALNMVAVMSQAVMAGADGVSITLPRDGQLRTVAASNDVVLQMDHDQYDTGEGPCLDAATNGEPYSSPELESERRWPQFVPRARSHGIESIMSTPLMSATGVIGALNVYSRAPRALASHEQEWATQFADEAARLLTSAGSAVTAGQIDAQVSGALRSRESIALAQGVIMSRQRMPAELAYRFLMDISRRTSRPLVQVCDDVLSDFRPGSTESGWR